jgi:uncharacterized UBP type Zn finger protein
LVTYFLNPINIEKDSNKSSPVNGIIADSFAKLIHEICSKAEGSSVTPFQFKKAISSHAPHLLDYQQQDCQEFLRFLLDGLSEDLCRSKAKKNSSISSQSNSDTTNSNSTTPQKASINASINASSSGQNTPQVDSDSNSNNNTPDDLRMMRLNSAQKLRMVTITERINNKDDNDNSRTHNNDDNPNPSQPESDVDNITIDNTTTTSDNSKKKSASEMANDAWQQYLDFNDSIVTDIFAGQLQSTIECLTCTNKSYCYDPFLDLSIPIKVDQINQPKTILKNFRFGSGGVSGKCSLEECIDMFVQLQKLIRCRYCNIVEIILFCMVKY